MQKIKRISVLFLTVIFVLGCTFSAYADMHDFLIGSSSNALMTLELNDDDYGVMPASSIGTVVNTLNASSVDVSIRYRNPDTGHTYYSNRVATLQSGRYHFSDKAPDGYDLLQFNIALGDHLPSPGTYKLSLDFASDFSIDWNYGSLYYYQSYKNANYDDGYVDLGSSFTSSSGDIYLRPFNVTIGNNLTFEFFTGVDLADGIKNVAGSFAVRFERSVPGTNTPNVGSDTRTEEFQNDLSSSMTEQADAIENVADAIQNLQSSMEPHYNNVLTQLHHITEQLHAFWDQQFNLHHVPLMAKLSDIIDAIGNMDLEVEVNLNSLKTSIDTMSQAVQNKVQSVADHITGGYDNSAMESEKSELSGSVEELEQAEKEVMDNVTGYLEDFEYPTFDSISGGVLASIAFIGTFLQSLFLAIGDFGLIITFSLTMIFVLIIVGYHRIRT